jgi:hypothetical protein
MRGRVICPNKKKHSVILQLFFHMMTDDKKTYRSIGFILICKGIYYCHEGFRNLAGDFI